MSTYDNAVLQPKKMLQNLGRWLDKAAAHAEEAGFDVEVLVESRLRPDMFPLRRQIQSACDTAKFIPARLSGKDAPTYADDEKTFAELQARVASVVSYLDTVTADDVEGTDDKEIRLRFLPEGVWVRGADYVTSFALPNFYFHTTTAYAILRLNGVGVGKRDYIGSMPLQGAPVDA